MKTTFALCFTLLALTSAHAQIYRPETVNGANGSARRTQVNPSRGTGYIYRHGPTVQIGADHGRSYHGHPGYNDHHYRGHRGYSHGFGFYSPRYTYGYVPSYGYYPGYGYGYPYYDTYGYYGSGSAATNGLLLGALAGGIIGHNSGDFRHNGWRGAAWGAGAGWLLGSVIDANRRPVVYGSTPVQQAPYVQAQAQPAAQTQPQQVTIINNYYNASTPMTAANGLFGR